MSVLVNQQDESIDVIEHTAATVQGHTEAGCAPSISTSLMHLTYLHQQLGSDGESGCTCARRSPQALDLLLPLPHHFGYHWYRRWCLSWSDLGQSSLIDYP